MTELTGGGFLLASPTGEATTFEADGLPISQTDRLGNLTTFTHTDADLDGHADELSQITFATGETVTYHYGPAGVLQSVTEPDGRVATFAFDGAGNLLSITEPDPDGLGPQAAPVTTLAWSGGLLAGVTNAAGETTSFGYDAAGNRLTLTDPVNNTTTWTYDALDRVIVETNALADARTFDYDAVGNVLRKTDRNGRVSEYDYDNLYRPTEERWLDGAGAVMRTLNWHYDAIGQIVSASDPAVRYTYQYDNLGRRTQVTHDVTGFASQVIMSSAYDLVGNRTQFAATIGATPDFVTDYAYDNLYRMSRVEQASSLLPGANTVADKRIDFAYDSASQWQTITRYADLAATQLVTTSTYSYDLSGRLTDLTHAQGTTTFADYGWTWDAANRISAFTNSIHLNEDATYSYDPTPQLTAADRSGTTDDESYTYDANGNRTTVATATHPGSSSPA